MKVIRLNDTKKSKKGKKKKSKKDNYEFIHLKLSKKDKKKSKKKGKSSYSSCALIPSTEAAGNAILRKHYRQRFFKSFFDIFNMDVKLKANVDLQLTDENITKWAEKGLSIVNIVSGIVKQNRNKSDKQD